MKRFYLFLIVLAFIPACAAASSADLPAGGSWQDLYEDFVINRIYELIGYPEYLPDNFDVTENGDGTADLNYVDYDYDPIWFSLYDLDNDRTPELLVFNGMGFMAGNAVHVYTVKDQSMVHVGKLGQRELMLAYSTDRRFPGLVQTDGNMGYFTTDYWYILNGGILCETIESIDKNAYPDEAAADNGEDAVITRETDDDDLYNWYHSSTFIPLAGYDYHTVTTLGWDTFVSDMLMEPVPQTVQDPSSPSPADEGGSQNSSKDLPEMVDFGVADEDIMFVSEGYYLTDVYNAYDYPYMIPVDVFCSRETYKANEPIVFSADILGGTPPFTVSWDVEESQIREYPTPLDRYIESHLDYSSYTAYTTNCRHVELVYTPPVESTTLFGLFSVTDSKGITNYSPNVNLATVYSLAEWKETYPRAKRPEDESFPFAAKSNRKNVNVRNGVGKNQEKLTTLSKAGTLVKVIGKSYDKSGKKWYIVRLSIDQTGYIRSDFLTSK